MSDHSREHLFVATTTTSAAANKKSPLSSKQQLANDDHHGKLTSSSSTSKYLSIELNNNSIVQQPGGERNLFKSETMESNKQPLQQPQKSSARVEAAKLAPTVNGSLLSTQQQQQQIPSYTSIFASPSYNRSISPAQEIQQKHKQQQQVQKTSPPGRRDSNKLRKQDAKDGSSLEIPTLSLHQKNLSLSPRKKSTTFEFADSDDAVKRDSDDDDDDDNQELNDEQSEESDDLGHEKQPFKSSLAKHLRQQQQQQHSKGRKSHNNSRGQSSNGYTDNCNSNKSPYQQQNKISFSESRPPSFGTCQAAAFNQHFHHQHANCNEAPHLHAPNKLDGWQMQPTVQCIRCDCSKCIKKHKIKDCSAIQMEGGGPFSSKTYTRTKSLHLVLKSIILVLLTLLLLMMFIGIILTAHYLPSVFDRVLNVSRSFNVTIAG